MMRSEKRRDVQTPSLPQCRAGLRLEQTLEGCFSSRSREKQLLVIRGASEAASSLKIFCLLAHKLPKFFEVASFANLKK
jgi:hypothetical protein